MTTDDRIHFLCVHADHSPKRDLDTVGPTVHQGLWAFCPRGADRSHAWVGVHAVDLVTLRRVLTRREPAELVGADPARRMRSATRAQGA